jgi:hypothetical protein
VATAARLAETLPDEGRQTHVVLTGHIQPAVAEALRARRVNYADASGNCHIERPPLLVHVEGRRRKRSGDAVPIRAFKGEGLKVIFVLLLCPEWVARPYRDLAALSGASHGVVQYTVKDLERLDYLVRLSRTARRLRDPPGLLDRWTERYAENLRPKLSMGTFRFTEPERFAHWQDLGLDGAHERWGGEPAAALATGYLSPGRLTIYSRRPRSDLMRHLRVVPDDEGPLEVVRSFWPLPLEDALPDRFAGGRVPDLLAYADLVASGAPRNAEVAALLRERHVEEDVEKSHD